MWWSASRNMSCWTKKLSPRGLSTKVWLNPWGGSSSIYVVVVLVVEGEVVVVRQPHATNQCSVIRVAKLGESSINSTEARNTHFEQRESENTSFSMGKILLLESLHSVYIKEWLSSGKRYSSQPFVDIIFKIQDHAQVHSPSKWLQKITTCQAKTITLQVLKFAWRSVEAFFT